MNGGMINTMAKKNKEVKLVHPVTEGLSLEASALMGITRKRAEINAKKAFKEWETEHKPRQFKEGVAKIVIPNQGIVNTRGAREDDVLDSKEAFKVMIAAGHHVEVRKDGAYTAEDIAIAALAALGVKVPMKKAITAECLVVTVNV